MSLAPASIRGFFLNARLAVNGIQCAARSFGTLTAAGRGLLSSMGASSKIWGMGGCPRKLSASSRHGNADAAQYFRAIGRIEAALRGTWRLKNPGRSQIRGADPEHFAVGILGIEPEQRQLRVGGLQRRPAAADFAQ